MQESSLFLKGVQEFENILISAKALKARKQNLDIDVKGAGII